ncbi:hypothetical protein [Streptomyces violaceorubidus]|uniref:Uncharacterized protein n=1 Tax=Streptomyces violaceorubidus TaxID=284042 RepID=A0ABV1T1I6_9ACTN
MNAPVQRSSERPSAAALAAARQRREEGRTGSSPGSGTSAEQAFLGFQSSAGNQAASATVQRARGRTLERTAGIGTDRPGSAPGTRRDPAGPTRRGSESGTDGMDVDPALREQATAARRAALAAGFTPSGRTRRASDSGARPGATGPTRRGSESGTDGMDVDPALREQAAAARRAAEEKAAAEEAAQTRRRVRAGAEAAAATARNRSTAKKAASEAAARGARLLEEAEAAAAEAAETERRRRAGAEAAAAKARERIAAAEAAAAEEDRLRRAAEAAAEADRRRRLEEEARPPVVEETRTAVEEEEAARPAVEGGEEARTTVEEEEEARAAVEEVTLTPEERAARDARLAGLAARFTSSGRTRRGSDLDVRPGRADLTRRGSDSGIRYAEVGAGPWERVDTAGDEDGTRTTPAEETAPPAEETAPPAEEEARRSGERAAAETRAEVRADRLKAVAENADQGKRLLDPVDALGKGVQAPTAAGLGQEATERAANAPTPDTGGGTGAEALKHDAAAVGVSGASLSAGAELLALGASVADAFRNLRTALRKRTGAGFHSARKKAKVKAGDAGVSVLSTGANAGAIAKEAVKIQGVASTAASAEASGVLSGVAGVAKSMRAVFKSGGAIRKFRGLGKLPDAEVAHAERLDTLKTVWEAEERRAKEAYAAVVALETEAEAGRRREGWDEALDAAATAYEAAAHREAQAKTAHLAAVDDARTVNRTKKLARRKMASKGAKEAVGGGLGEGLKGAGGITTVAVVATGALASNPAGWIIAAVGAGLVVGVAAYKGVRSGYGRFQEAHHPELYTPHGEEVPEALPTWESLKHAMKAWKKISRYKRQLAAHKLYGMLSRPDTEPELRRSAMDLLVVLKAGPDDHGMDRPTWEASLMDPANKADWIKEITDQLSSGS